MGEFLEKIGLGHHVAAFIENDISGEVLLKATEEILEELGVTSPTERLKIKVHVMEGRIGMPSPYFMQQITNSDSCVLPGTFPAQSTGC